MKQISGIIIALLIGVAGGYLFSKSQPPERGSLEERVEIAEREAQRYRGYYKAVSTDVARRKDTSSDRLRETLKKIKEGEEVSFDDIFTSMKPWMRDMAPIFERMQAYNAEEFADRQTGEWTRKYNLSQADKEVLRAWFAKKHLEQSNRVNRVIESNRSGFVDMIQATESTWRDLQGVEDVMGTILKGEELEQFREEQLTKRVKSVESEANRNLARLDEIVGLEADQTEQLFGIMARGSSDYRANIDVDGIDSDSSILDHRARDREMRKLLTPEQTERLDEKYEQRRQEASEEMSRMGLSLPRDWDLLGGDIF